jgi:hypothetical protein
MKSALRGSNFTLEAELASTSNACAKRRVIPGHRRPHTAALPPIKSGQKCVTFDWRIFSQRTAAVAAYFFMQAIGRALAPYYYAYFVIFVEPSYYGIESADVHQEQVRIREDDDRGRRPKQAGSSRRPSATRLCTAGPRPFHHGSPALDPGARDRSPWMSRKPGNGCLRLCEPWRLCEKS